MLNGAILAAWLCSLTHSDPSDIRAGGVWRAPVRAHADTAGQPELIASLRAVAYQLGEFEDSYTHAIDAIQVVERGSRARFVVSGRTGARVPRT
jgi:hypothetical protein